MKIKYFLWLQIYIFVVRYTSTASLKADRPKHNYRNSTDLNAMLDDLRPNTQYIFCVKALFGDGSFLWSDSKSFRTK